MLPPIPVAGSAFPQGVAEGSGVPLYEVLYDGWASFALTPEKTGGQLFLTLRSRNLAEVEKAGEPRACSANLLLARTPGVVRNLEVSPHTVRTLGPEDGALVHANPFPEPPMQGGLDGKGSLTRQRQLSRHPLDNTVSLDDVQNGLRDRKNAPYRRVALAPMVGQA